MSRTNKVITIIVLAVLIGSGAWYFFAPSHTMSMTADMHHGGADHDSSEQRNVLYWHDPMVPGQRFDKPGPSPFMDMQLVPVYADDSDTSEGVSISAQTQQNLGIRTTVVRMGEISKEAVVQGNVVWNEHAIDVISARATGFIERLYVRAAMEAVKQGQALAEIYVPDWIAVQEEYLLTRDLGGEIGQQLKSGALLRMRVAGMTDSQIAEVVRDGKVHARVTIRAPRSGVLSELNVRAGETVSLGMPLFRISGLNPIWLEANVPESLISSLNLGDTVEVMTVARKNQRYPGKVALLPPEIDQVTRAQRVRIELANPRAELLPGMFASLVIKQNSVADALLVPTEAIITTGSRKIVFTVNDDGKFNPNTITAGLESDTETEVLSGLSAGQNVVTSGQFLVDSEASLKGVMSRMQESAP
ncbi:Cu(I)/Ag(I) efflux system membrane fusion protein [Paraperlucidibaca baekdonensis]|uniref:Cu(I)/Ag(I) efflux system membrane fusion protein n=1 Tax=Paraperlucidibaca baekdonensis TaxID=748120 RepID=A0A3E0H2B5_9GAMM|nr:efflux RND transporter periplasmic adaptor subunit [Paraperlucidibaca baekdonensis]REH36122.1 Cu(I)/Ag(I) efflux system membrane fusion protein [Paraperlucidibaca baekdonensis]